MTMSKDESRGRNIIDRISEQGYGSVVLWFDVVQGISIPVWGDLKEAERRRFTNTVIAILADMSSSEPDDEAWIPTLQTVVRALGSGLGIPFPLEPENTQPIGSNPAPSETETEIKPSKT